VIAALAVVSSVLIAVRPSNESEGLLFWTFAKPHAEMYRPIIAERNARTDPDVEMRQLALAVVEQRMLGGFFAGVPTADLIEVERGIAGRAFTGPLETVGFADLTDRLEAEGLIDAINPASFGPWTSRGRIFGIPHDVHPVMLGYRHDITEAAGVDMSRVKTWADLGPALAPAVTDEDGDGEPDRYPLAFWPTDLDKVELLLLQGGGRLFDDEGASTSRARPTPALLARMVSWCVGPDRIACEVPDFSMSGDKLKEQGYAVCYFFPDWMCDVWNKEISSLSGTMRLMPLPAWEPGGRRTSVWGGHDARHPEDDDRLRGVLGVRQVPLLLRRARAGALPRRATSSARARTGTTRSTTSPIRTSAGRPRGGCTSSSRPHIPARTSSPYSRRAVERLGDAGMRTLIDAKQRGAAHARRAPPVAMKPSPRSPRRRSRGRWRGPRSSANAPTKPRQPMPHRRPRHRIARGG
jgi:arabinosaccharide transport system substrate-binding protein